MAWPLFEELSSSPELKISRGGNSVVRRFKVAGDDLINFCQYLCNGSDTAWSGTPAQSGTGLSANYIYLSDLDATPLGGDELHPTPKTMTSPLTDANSYSYWLVTATYTPYPYNKAWPTCMTKPSHTAGSTLSVRIRSSVEYITFTANFVKWTANPDGTGGTNDTDPPPMGVPGRILIPTADVVVSWDRITDPPVDSWMAVEGRVNNAAFMGFSAQTLLFESYDLDESLWLSTTNPYKYKADLSFKFRSVGWNREFRDSPPYGWHYIVTVDGQPRYPLATFSGLFSE
jgi:hypothetical protein